METAAFFVSIRTAVGMALTMLFGIMCDKLGVKKSVPIYGLLFSASCILGPVIGGKVGAFILACFAGTPAFSTMFIGIGFPLVIGYKNIPTFAG